MLKGVNGRMRGKGECCIQGGKREAKGKMKLRGQHGNAGPPGLVQTSDM